MELDQRGSTSERMNGRTGRCVCVCVCVCVRERERKREREREKTERRLEDVEEGGVGLRNGGCLWDASPAGWLKGCMEGGWR